MYRVLIVDDSEENLFILKNALKDDYKISVAKDGLSALNLINNLLPDIILLDIMMPGLDGYDTLRRIKQIKRFEDTPVIFITAESDITNKTKGFQLGAVDYILKPYELLEVKLRVKTHLELSKSREEKQELLSNTLAGTIQALMEIISTTNPFAFSFSNRSKKLAVRVAMDLGIEELWKIEIASMLSMVGTYMMESKALEQILSGREVSSTDRKEFVAHPNLGSKLVAKIPRLEDIAEIIKSQMEPLGYLDFDRKNIALAGAQILNVVNNYQSYIIRGSDKFNSIILLMQNREVYNTTVLKSLERVIRNEEVSETMHLTLAELTAGMIMDEDITAQNGNIIITKGTGINDLIIEHLKLLNEMGKMGKYVRVRMGD